MKISARNQFAGKITKVNEGVVNGMVTIDAGNMEITGTISMAAIKELGLTEGEEATAVIKATEVMVGLEQAKISARNQFAGTVKAIEEGAVNCIVKIDVAGKIVSATISKNAVCELGLKEGMNAVAIVKATSVLFAK